MEPTGSLPNPPRMPVVPPLHRPSPLAWLRARGWRSAIGIGIAGAALVLSVLFLLTLADGRSWWQPFAVGVGALVLLSLLRLDRLLKGWTWHVAGIVLIGALIVWTDNRWAWAFAASLGVLLAGLMRLPRWPVAVAGAVLLAASVVGFGLRASEISQQQADQEAKASLENRLSLQGVQGAQAILPMLDRSISGPAADPAGVCGSVTAAAAGRLAAATGAPDCQAAVAVIHSRRVAAGGPPLVTSVPHDAEPQTADATYLLDGCASGWTAAAGPQLGRVQADRNAKGRYLIAAFLPC